MKADNYASRGIVFCQEIVLMTELNGNGYLGEKKKKGYISNSSEGYTQFDIPNPSQLIPQYLVNDQIQTCTY